MTSGINFSELNSLGFVRFLIYVRPSMPWVTNVPKEPLRWTLARASSEFQVSIPTLTTKLNQANQVSAADRSFTTRQLVESLYGNVHAERLRKTREEADKLALGNAIVRGEFVNRAELEQLHAAIANHIKSVVRSSRLPRSDQDDVLRSMSDVKFRVDAIVAAQRGANNGQQGNGNSAGAQEPARRKRGRPRKSAEPKEAKAEQPAAAG